jgi:hypothetical protein
MLGYPQTVSLNQGNTQRYFRASSYNWFVQHDWKYSRRMTFNLGLRYEVNTAPIEKDNILSNFNPKTSQIELAGKDIPRGIFSNDLNNFGPRVGLAYNLSEDGKTIARAGYGIYYNQQVWSAVLTGSAQSTRSCQRTPGMRMWRDRISLRDPLAGAIGGRPHFRRLRFHSAYMQQYSFGINELQHDRRDFALKQATKSTSRVGNQRGRFGKNRRPFPAYASLN